MADQPGSSASASVFEEFETILFRLRQETQGNEISDVESTQNELRRLNCSIEELWWRCEDKYDSGKGFLKKMLRTLELIEGALDEYVLQKSQLPRGYLRRFRTLKGNQDPKSLKISDLASILNEADRMFVHPKYSKFSDPKSLKFSDPMASTLRSLNDTLQFHLSGRKLSEITASNEDLINNHVLGGNLRRSAVVFLGEGGIGKTTLATEIVNQVQNNFNFVFWIGVSYYKDGGELVKYTANRILTATGYGYQDQVETMTEKELIILARKNLMRRRYLLVFDDVWMEDFVHVIRDMFPDENMGSRIIVTTRNGAIAASCKEAWSGHVHRVDPLSEATSLRLFYREVFKNDCDGHCPPELEDLSVKIIRICEGLPLAIVSIADLLSKKEKVASEWRKLIDNFSVEIQSNHYTRSVWDALGLRFHDLPLHLKLCFLYFSLFPKESLIPNDKLFKLWIAEGFVQEEIGKTLEEVCKEYLNELIGRYLVQTCEGFYGVEKVCRLSNLMHEMAMQKAKQSSFFQIWDSRESRLKVRSRRVLICTEDVRNDLEGIEQSQVRYTFQNYLQGIEQSQVRSILLSNIGAINDSILGILFKKYKFLTLLDVENSPLEFLPNEVGNLVFLKYLSLKNTKVKKLPKTIGKLGRLQTLDVSGTLLVELPMVIFKLKNLRHLLATRCDNQTGLESAKGVKVKEGIGYLVNLQTLMTVDSNLSGMDVIQELGKLKQLRSLSVSRLTEELANALCACIEHLSHLESLRLQSMSNHDLNVQSLSTPPPQLERLVLKGALQGFPEWISHLQNLVMLCLSLSSLADSPLRHLSKLPNLECLWLYRAYEGLQIHFNDGDFLRLKLLVLREMRGLESVVIEYGAMPLLEELRIGPSPLLNEVPVGIVHLTNLKVISFYDMPNEFVLNMKSRGGSEYWKVDNGPSVLFWYRDIENRYISYKRGESDLSRRLEGLDTSENDLNRRDHRMSFSYSDDEEDNASTSSFRLDHIARSNTSSFFTDDVEQ